MFEKIKERFPFNLHNKTLIIFPCMPYSHGNEINVSPEAQICMWSTLLSGRVRYKFASFWNRNHALRGLQRAVKNYHDMLEAEKKVQFLALSHFRVYCRYWTSKSCIRTFARKNVNMSISSLKSLSWYILTSLYIRTVLLDFQQNIIVVWLR